MHVERYLIHIADSLPVSLRVRYTGQVPEHEAEADFKAMTESSLDRVPIGHKLTNGATFERIAPNMTSYWVLMSVSESCRWRDIQRDPEFMVQTTRFLAELASRWPTERRW